jgi:transposase
MQSLYSSPYSPELNGIEEAWAIAKHEFRKRVTQFRLTGERWCIQDQVGQILRQIPQKHYQSCAANGWKNVRSHPGWVE